MADVTVEFGALDTGLEKTLKAVQDELTQLKGKVSSGDLSMTELESTMKRIGQVTSMEKNIKAIGDASSDSSPKIKNLGDSIESTGDKTKKTGDIFDDEFKRMGAAFTVGNLAAEGFQKTISLVFDAARAVVQGFSDALDLGGRLNDLSARTGEAAGTLLVLETAFRNSGLEAAQVGTAINKLQNFMQAAANGGAAQIQTMNGLGISLSDLAGKMPTDQMQLFADKIAGIQDPTQRAATASDIFGDKLGGKLLPLLVDFSGNLDDARDKVGSLEQVMNENAATFDKFAESIEAVKGKMAAFAAGVLSETIPALENLGSKMEGVDATGLGEIIGQILNPAIKDLTNNITLAADIFGVLKTAASDVGAGLTGSSDSFKDGATQANQYLQVLAALLPAGIDPLSLGLKAVASVSDDATKGMNDVSTAANNASPALATIGNQAVDTGAKINTAFTLTADLKPELDSIGSGWGDISDKIQTGNSLLDGTGAAFGTIAQSTQSQVAGIGGINDQLTVSEQLNKLILDLVTKTADKEADAAAKAAKKVADQQIQNQLKQDELIYQLNLAQAQAVGDSARVTALQDSKKYADDVQKALAAGLDPTQAATFATNMAIAATNSANIKQYDKDGNVLFYKAAEMSAKLNENLKSATGFADTLANMKEIKALDKAQNSAKAAKDELEAMDKLLGTDLAQKSFPDLVKKLNIDKIGQTGEDQIRAVVKYLNGVKTDLSKNPIDSQAGQAAIDKVRNSIGKSPFKGKLALDSSAAQKNIKSLGDIPVTVTAKVDKNAFNNSIANLNAQIKNNFKGGEGGKGGGGGTGTGGQGGTAGNGGEGGKGGDAIVPLTLGDVLSSIKAFVETIKEKVVSLENKLPQPVLQ